MHPRPPRCPHDSDTLTICSVTANSAALWRARRRCRRHRLGHQARRFRHTTLAGLQLLRLRLRTCYCAAVSGTAGALRLLAWVWTSSASAALSPERGRSPARHASTVGGGAVSVLPSSSSARRPARSCHDRRAGQPLCGHPVRSWSDRVQPDQRDGLRLEIGVDGIAQQLATHSLRVGTSTTPVGAAFGAQQVRRRSARRSSRRRQCCSPDAN